MNLMAAFEILMSVSCHAISIDRKLADQMLFEQKIEELIAEGYKRVTSSSNLGDDEFFTAEATAGGGTDYII